MGRASIGFPAARAARAAVALLALLLLVAVAGPAGAADRRVALVIGNGAYAHAPALPNPPNDAAAVAAALQRIGFEVLSGRDLDKEQTVDLLRRFERSLKDASVGLVFYAGHGLQVDGRNYLIPIDAQLESEADLQFDAVPLDVVLGQLERAVPVQVVFLDACRDNPLARTLARSMGRTRSSALGQGLAPARASVGALIAYATQPDNVALDGDGAHSPFTAALLRHLDTPGLEIRQMLTRVRKSVLEETDGRQVPWDHSSLTGDFYLAGLPTPKATGDAGSVEAAFWGSIEGSGNPADFRDYLKTFPDGAFRPLAERRLAALTGAGASDAAPAAAGNRPPVVEPAAEVALVLGTPPALAHLRPYDPDGDAVSIVVSAVEGGTLRADGRAVAAGDRLTPEQFLALAPGPADTRALTPASGRPASAVVLSYRAEDGRGGVSNGTLTLRPVLDDCDRLAAIPQDPAGVAPGVAWHALRPEAAVAACRAAVTRFPDVPRLKAELGRALIKLGRYDEALPLLRVAAEGGLATAEDGLGIVFLHGLGVAEDAATARLWFEKAAAQGLPSAQSKLGWLYRNGLGGLARDPAEAARWFERAAAQGSEEGRYNLAGLYAQGLGVAQDLGRARALFREAAEAGFPLAQNDLGTVLAQGLGGPADTEAAIRWWARAAASDHAEAGELARENLRLVPPPDLVRAAQRMLADAGYDPGPADGAMGPKTRDALAALARAAGIAPPAAVTPETLEALARALPQR